MFRSGHWCGWYMQRGARRESSAQIAFVDGRMIGHGRDEVGAFTIEGEYNQKSLSAEWLKTYVDRHSVRYAGTLAGNVLQGSWKIADPGCGANGSFELTAPALPVVR